MANKTCTFEMPEELWQALKVISSETGESIKAIVNFVLKNNVVNFVKSKNISGDTLALIEKKLKAIE